MFWFMVGALASGEAHAQDAEPESPLPRVRLTARGGYTNYSRLHFVTGEAEVAVRVVSGLHAVAGIAVYGVELEPPPQRQLETGKLTEWAALAPIHVGARYQVGFLDDLLMPFVGVDALTGQYYQGADGVDWAFGARLRAGLDVMVLEQLGVHANFGLGVWSGDRWSDLETGVPNAGPLPQVSLGVTLAL